MTMTPRDVAAAYAAAIDALDTDALLALYAEDARPMDAFLWRSEGITHWADNVNQWFGAMQSSNGTRTENLAVVEGPEVAGLSMDVLYDGRDHEGTDQRMWNRLTWVLRRDGDRWLIAQEHTSVPLKMDDMTADFRSVD